ncbi:MAG: biotin-dependent carboxyltransferase family protein [Selenomonadaceae bacterium]
MTPMKIKVLDGGLMTTVQDMGRVGYQKYGIIQSGAIDTFSLAVANLAVGNDTHEAALEMTLKGAMLELKRGIVFVLAGADMMATIGGIPVPMHRPVLVTQDATLVCGGPRHGARTYIAFAGNIDVPKRMASRSTYMRAGIGGYDGRALKDGDELTISSDEKITKKLYEIGHKISDTMISVDWFTPRVTTDTTRPIRVTRGLQADWFTKETLESFFSSKERYRVTVQADRMGYRLMGKTLELKEPRELISEPVAFGTVQVADGKPIVLMADRQTTGGYPKIAQIAMVDLPRFGQTRAGDTVSFSEISLAEAERLYIEQRTLIAKAATAAKLVLG